MEPTVYKNFKFGTTQVKYLYQGRTLVWPPTIPDSSSYDGSDPKTGRDSSMISFTEITMDGNIYHSHEDLSFHGGAYGDASLYYDFNGHYYKNGNFKLGIGEFDDGTVGFTVLMDTPGALDGTVYIKGEVWENSTHVSLSPGLLIQEVDGQGFKSSGIFPASTPLEEPGSATEEITLPGLFRKIAFKSNDNFLVTSGNSSLHVPTMTMKNPADGSTAIPILILPANATSIGSYMFYNNTFIKSVDIKGSIPSIPEYCFYNCTSLESFRIPESVTSIADYAFYKCTSIKTIDAYCVTPPSCAANSFTNIKTNGLLRVPETANASSWITWYTNAGLKSRGWTLMIGNQVVDSSTYDSTHIIKYVTNDKKELFPSDADWNYRSIVFHMYDKVNNYGILVYQNTVTSLPNQTFANRTNLTAMEFPSTLTSMGQGAFYNCTALETFTIPSTVTSVGGSLFDRCSNLHTVIFEAPSHVSEIPNNMFNNSGLTSIDLPASITKIHGTPWTGIHKLEYIRFEGANPPVLTDYTGEPNSPEYSAFYDTWWWKDGVQYFPPIYVPNVNTYKNSSTEWYYWWEQGRLAQG